MWKHAGSGGAEADAIVVGQWTLWTGAGDGLRVTRAMGPLRATVRPFKRFFTECALNIYGVFDPQEKIKDINGTAWV